MKQTTIGFVDLQGTFILPLREHHVDPYKEDKLGFFRKISYHEKLKEYNEAVVSSLYTIRDISDAEQQKFQMWNCYAGIV